MEDECQKRLTTKASVQQESATGKDGQLREKNLKVAKELQKDVDGEHLANSKISSASRPLRCIDRILAIPKNTVPGLHYDAFVERGDKNSKMSSVLPPRNTIAAPTATTSADSSPLKQLLQDTYQVIIRQDWDLRTDIFQHLHDSHYWVNFVSNQTAYAVNMICDQFKLFVLLQLAQEYTAVLTLDSDYLIVQPYRVLEFFAFLGKDENENLAFMTPEGPLHVSMMAASHVTWRADLAVQEAWRRIVLRVFDMHSGTELFPPAYVKEHQALLLASNKNERGEQELAAESEVVPSRSSNSGRNDVERREKNEMQSTHSSTPLRSWTESYGLTEYRALQRIAGRRWKAWYKERQGQLLKAAPVLGTGQDLQAEEGNDSQKSNYEKSSTTSTSIQHHEPPAKITFGSFRNFWGKDFFLHNLFGVTPPQIGTIAYPNALAAASTEAVVKKQLLPIFDRTDSDDSTAKDDLALPTAAGAPRKFNPEELFDYQHRRKPSGIISTPEHQELSMLQEEYAGRPSASKSKRVLHSHEHSGVTDTAESGGTGRIVVRGQHPTSTSSGTTPSPDGSKIQATAAKSSNILFSPKPDLPPKFFARIGHTPHPVPRTHIGFQTINGQNLYGVRTVGGQGVTGYLLGFVLPNWERRFEMLEEWKDEGGRNIKAKQEHDLREDHAEHESAPTNRSKSSPTSTSFRLRLLPMCRWAYMVQMEHDEFHCDGDLGPPVLVHKPDQGLALYMRKWARLRQCKVGE
ncbi:unnamed protein product [Amoebophrya sp. A120]|nr:unnamed protein product [Amoebophrya sp. A120]|eukprot:GSA120T00012531001.1